MAGEAVPDSGRAVDFDQTYARGRETFAALVPGGGERLDEIFAIAPDLAQMAVGVVYGYLHHRPVLDPRTREVAALAAIIASGTCGTPLAVHVHTALAAGLAPAEIVEVVLEGAAFGGFPRAVSALPVVEDVFGQAGVRIPTLPSPREIVLTAIDEARNWPRNRRTQEGDVTWAALMCKPGIDVAVYTISPDHAIAVALSSSSNGPETVFHVRVEEDRIAEVTTLQRAGDVLADRAVPGPGVSARHALTKLLEDLATVGHGPAAEMVIADPELLNETAPLQGILAKGIRPQVTAIDSHTAVAIFRDTGMSHPVLALAFADAGQIHHVHVIQTVDASCGPGGSKAASRPQQPGQTPHGSRVRF